MDKFFAAEIKQEDVEWQAHQAGREVAKALLSAKSHNIPTVKTVAEAKKLPAGTIIRTPDGRFLKVPKNDR